MSELNLIFNRSDDYPFKFCREHSKYYDVSNGITRYKDEDCKPSYDNFFKEHLIKNVPCLFGDWLTKDWKFRREWIIELKRINYSYLIEKFGNACVPVADCKEKYFNSQKKDIWQFSNYIDFIRRNSEYESKECFYLKDWHFVHSYPDYQGYITPDYFASDWLNEFWSCKENKEDDYRFVYIGPKGSWTPFHADVFRSFSWSSNICGRKKWIFYPPKEENKLKDQLGNLIYDVESIELSDGKKYPDAQNVEGKIEVYQEKGETIFVPSSWHHQVWNLEDTISVNHNWINGGNIAIVLEFILSSLKEVEVAIEDCSGMDGWSDQCQLILKSTHGMDFREFFTFLKVIAQRRIQYLQGDLTVSSFSDWKLGRQHVVFDLQMIQFCLLKLLDESKINVSQIFSDEDHPTTLLDTIHTHLL